MTILPHDSLRLCLSLFLTFLPVSFGLNCCYLIFNRREDQSCPSKTNGIQTKQILLAQSWFVFHCGFRTKLGFIVCLNFVMQTCFSDYFNTQLLRDNLEKKNFPARLNWGKTQNQNSNKKPNHRRKSPAMSLNR